MADQSVICPVLFNHEIYGNSDLKLVAQKDIFEPLQNVGTNQQIGFAANVSGIMQIHIKGSHQPAGASAQQHNPVSQQQGFINIMRDKNHREFL